MAKHRRGAVNSRGAAGHSGVDAEEVAESQDGEDERQVEKLLVQDFLFLLQPFGGWVVVLCGMELDDAYWDVPSASEPTLAALDGHHCCYDVGGDRVV
jgi:hypothetical protein